MDYDVIIIGARIAGSTLAGLLGDEGQRVLLLDRESFPSDTLSTHFFRAPTLRALQALGVREQVEASAPRLTVNYNAVDGIVFPEPVDRPDDYPYYLCVRRVTLDNILVERARGTDGVDLHENAVATDLLWQDDRCVGVRWREDGEIHEARARAVVGADGVYSFVARKVEPEEEHRQPVQRAMYYAYFHGVEPQDGPAAEFHYRGNHLAYCMPTSDDLTMMAASVPMDKFDDFKSDPEGNLMRYLSSMSALAPRLQGIEREGPVFGTGNIPCYRRVPYGPGWALVGDAGMVMDPWSGQGIDQGSTHAVMLAEQLSSYLRGERAWEAAMGAYHDARDEFSRKPYRHTAAFASDLRPMTRKALQERDLI